MSGLDAIQQLAQETPSSPQVPDSIQALAQNGAAPPAQQTTGTQGAQPSAFQQDVVRPIGLLDRAVITGAAGLPLLAADTGVGARNMIGDWYHREMGQPATPDYQLPSTLFQQSLTQAGLPVPHGLIEKVIGGAEGMLAGGATGTPEADGELPANFQTADERALGERLRAVKNGMDRGYRIPPATTNPTLFNKGVETVGGKLATQQAASWSNQQVTNALAGEAIGLHPSVPITAAATQAARADAAHGYQAISKIKSIPLDSDFKAAVQGIVGKFNGLATELPTLASKDLQPVADDLLGKGSISGDTALSAIRSLRDKASTAFRAGNSGEGAAFKQLANELENGVDRGLSSLGDENSSLVQGFRSSRQKIAIAHSVEDAINPGTNNVVAAKLGRALNNGEPLSGPLRTIAEFANAAPKAVAEPLTSPVHHLNLAGEMLGGGLGAIAHGPIGAAIGTAAYPAARALAKWFAMNPGQALAIPGEAGEAPLWLRGAAGAYEAGKSGNSDGHQ